MPRWLLSGLLTATVLLAGCSTSPPRQQDDICAIFTEKDDWYDDAMDAQERWGSPVPITMSMMRHESSFRADARPPRRKILWIFPGPRLSSAYGYSQAKTATWAWYKGSSGNWGADRDDFADAIDFIAWYNSISTSKNGIRRDDAYSLYLAYHEGHGGFSRGTHRGKGWLLNTAAQVRTRAQMYQTQLSRCEKDLKRGWWPF